jgi:ATP-dependent DNA helicase DinG
MSQYIDSILGVGGTFSKESIDYQPRPQQIEMANAVELSLNSGKHALIEAGTGTGKTFAYLVPAINYALKNDSKIVISTKTKNLQSQILNKDIPFLKKILPCDFKVEKVVGIGNFICFHRLEKYLDSDNIDNIKEIKKLISFYCKDTACFNKLIKLSKQKRTLLDEEEEEEKNSSIKRIKAIISESEEYEGYDDIELEAVTGTKEEYGEVDNQLWSSVCAESDSCHKKTCEFYEQCFYYKAKERQKEANILIVNHALFFADLAIRKSLGFVNENAVIPKHSIAIFDEAHDIENVAANFMGIQLSNYRLKYFVNTLVSNINNNKSLRAAVGTKVISKMILLVEEVTTETVNFFNDIREKFINKDGMNIHRIKEPYFADNSGILKSLEGVKNSLLDIIREMGALIIDGKIEIGSARGQESEIKDIKVFIERTNILIQHINKLVGMTDKDWAYWVDISEKKVSICGSPVDIAKELRGSLFGRITCILTSATIAVNGKFSFIAKRLGLEDIDDSIQLMVGSPFNYFQQAMLCIPEDSMEPTVNNSEAFSERIADQIKRIVKISNGRAFVLFTSYKLMNDVYNIVEDTLSDWGYPVFRQSSGCSREKLIQKFLDNDNSILFGAESFWQGIDVPGDKLSCVIIPKIPFANPSEPLIAARMDFIKKQGQNPFLTYSLPDSVLRLKQGTGRLIRRESDKGVLAILDRRILTKGYGTTIINSLPNYYQTKDIDHLKLVFNEP